MPGSAFKARWLFPSAWLLCLMATSVCAQNRPSDYIYQVWQTDQGMPENSATAMVETPDAYLWLGTFNGLVRFDGVKFTVFDRSNTPELPSPGIVNLYLDHSGRLWVSTLLGLALVKDGHWRRFRQSDGWVGDYVWRFAESASGDLYLSTFDHRLLRFRGDRFEPITPPPVANPELGFQPYVDETGKFWIIHPQFIGRWVDGKWQETVSAADLMKKDPVHPQPPLMAGPSRDGGLWIVTHQHLLKYRAGRLVFETRAPWTMESFWSLHEDTAGGVWITSSAEGLYHFSPDGRWQHFTTQDALPYHAVRFVFEDREHNLWVGTSGGGLERFKHRYLMNWGLEQGLPERVVKSLTSDSQGRMFFGTWGEGVARLEGTKITRLLRPYDPRVVSPDGGCRSFFDGLVMSTLADRRGRLWVGTYARGLYQMEGSVCRGFFASAGNSPQVSSLFEDSQGRIWIGTQEGVLSFDGKRFRNYGMESAPPGSRIRSFAEDRRAHSLWAGNAAGGLYRLDGERFVPVSEAPGLLSEHISVLLADEDGTLWIGTEDGGIAALGNHRVVRISEKQGLPTRRIASILDDGLGNLWFGSNRGILRASRRDLEEIMSGHKNEIEFQIFNQSDGMATTQCSMESQPSAVRDRDGKLWFATFKGAVMIDPKTLRLNPQPPALVIEQVLIDDQPAGSSQPFATSAPAPPVSVTVPAGDHRLEIHYAGLSFTAPEKVHFRFMLDDFDKNWIDVGDRRVAYLQHMKPGKYRFRLRAANNDGVWNEAGAMAPLNFKPHFYETYWFYSTCILGVLLFGAGIHRRRLRDLQARASQLKRLVEERTMDLAKQSAFLQQILDINPNFIFAKDREGRFTLVNRALADHFRTQPEALIGKTDREVALGREADAFRRDDIEVMNTLREKLIPEEPVTDAEGNVRWVQTVKRPILGEDGKAHQVLGVATDITERKRTEEELQRREAEYRRLVEDIPEVVWRTNEQGDALLISAKVTELFGYTPEEIYREGAKLWFRRIHPDDLERVRKAYTKLFQENRPYDVEYRIQHRDGHWIWCHDRAVRIDQFEGGRSVAEGLVSDITERKLAEQELIQHREHLEEEVAERTAELTRANKQLRQEIAERKQLEEQFRQAQKMEAIGTLSGGIAHDFNNLLTVIQGYGRMVLDRVEQDPELRRFVEQIDEAAERAASLTTQLLAFSRRQVMQPKVINLNALTMKLDKMLERLIGEDIEMITVPAPDLDSIKADPGQMEQVIMNLVVNARDAMPQGGRLTLETANVELDEAYRRQHPEVSPGRYVMLAVSDTGIGMDQETLSRIFEPFFTTKEQGRGTGLGLSMVYGIVKQSGGHIWVYSEPGQGTTFKLYFPVVNEPADSLMHEEMLSVAYPGTGTILLVEDDRQVRELASSILTGCGYSVLVAETTRSALTISEEHPGPIDLLLTDVVMPGFSGRELANQVIARRPGIKVLYMSGYAMNAIVHNGVLDPGTFFLSKPFTPVSLASKVRELLHAPGIRSNFQPEAERKNTA